MELFAADGHDAGGCERVTGKSGMRPLAVGSGRNGQSRERAASPAEDEAPLRGLGRSSQVFNGAPVGDRQRDIGPSR